MVLEPRIGVFFLEQTCTQNTPVTKAPHTSRARGRASAAPPPVRLNHDTVPRVTLAAGKPAPHPPCNSSRTNGQGG